LADPRCFHVNSGSWAFRLQSFLSFLLFVSLFRFLYLFIYLFVVVVLGGDGILEPRASCLLDKLLSLSYIVRPWVSF
jgi:hypothetical protein